METAELVFIPSPAMGHVAQLLELAKLMIDREKQLSITILIMKLPDDIDSVSSAFIDSVAASSNEQPRLQFFLLPPANPKPEWSSRTRGHFVNMLIQSQKPHVKDFIDQRLNIQSTTKLVGFVVDMLCSNAMIEVADHFGLPSYVFLTSGAAFLDLMLHFQKLQDENNQDISEFKDSVTELAFSSFSNPVPPSVLPLVFVDKQMWCGRFLHLARGYRKAKGILVNTFVELESYALNSLAMDSTVPPIYPVGPILNTGADHKKWDQKATTTMKWLDEQPPSSVVFICFGSQGGLHGEQVKELAYGLEHSGFRFLCALRKPSTNNKAGFPIEYESYEEVLPQGFMERTAEIGKVVGWVPQLAVLSHAAVGGFVSHCGWNSVLESVWCGVPIVTWPLHSEQQLNAFQLVKELGLAVEITLDYSEGYENQPLLAAEEIENGIRILMERDSDVRKKVKVMSKTSRTSMQQGGSSNTSLERLIQRIIN